MSEDVVIGWVNFWSPKDEWYYLPAGRRTELLAQWQVIHEDVFARGARRLGSYETRASTAWARVSLWEFPSFELLMEMVDRLGDAAYYEFFSEENAFGRRTEEPHANYLAAADATAAFVKG
jgi:hypothetical protein